MADDLFDVFTEDAAATAANDESALSSKVGAYSLASSKLKEISFKEKNVANKAADARKTKRKIDDAKEQNDEETDENTEQKPKKDDDDDDVQIIEDADGDAESASTNPSKRFQQEEFDDWR